ncbi:MAG: hypothetical protein ACP5O2_06695 [Bacteroidales bacterium]
MEKTSDQYNPFERLRILWRKIRLTRRIGHRRKAERKMREQAARLRQLNERQWQKRRQRRLIRFVIRRSIRKLFQQKKTEIVVPEIKTTQLKEAASYTIWGRRKRIICFLLRRFYHNLRYGDPESRRKGYTLWKTIGPAGKLAIVLNSWSSAIVAYFLVSFTGQLLNTLVASTFNYAAVIRYYRVIYFISPREYTTDAVKTLFSIEPFTALFLGIMALIVYLYVRPFEGTLKQIFLWAYVWGMVLFFGALAVGNIFTKGFGHVITYMYLMDTAKLIITMGALGVLLLVGTFSRALFLSQANCYFQELNQYNLRGIVLYQVVWPYFLATAFIVLIKLPQIQYYEGFTLLTGLIFILPVWQSPGLEAEMLFEYSGRLYLRRKILIFSILIWILYRFFTDPFLFGR